MEKAHVHDFGLHSIILKSGWESKRKWMSCYISLFGWNDGIYDRLQNIITMEEHDTLENKEENAKKITINYSCSYEHYVRRRNSVCTIVGSRRCED